ncbi:hypothetical protein [Mucilaginibacter sp. L196]|uniref:hypothetical protein n=1 Tax=Mucilaginibacter sp. L196 TaxID=1641870 RepID=UPI00131E8111|nr:hypothetical protein [Mucilaginibacter sp. L196]
MKHLYTAYEFDSFAEAISNFIPILILVLLGLVGLGIYLYSKQYIDPDIPGLDLEGYTYQTRQMRAGIFLIAISCLVTPFVFFGFGLDYMRTTVLYRNRNFNIIEGKIQLLRDSLDREGNVLVLFSIDTVRFEIAHYDQAYKEVRDRKLFRDSSIAHISYLPSEEDDKRILKLEIKL